MVLGGAILFIEPTAVRSSASTCRGRALRGRRDVVGDRDRLRHVVAHSRHVRLFGHEISLNGWRMAIVQVVMATVDVAITASIFYALLPTSPRSDITDFWRLYRRLHRGLESICPAGIGVFDTTSPAGNESYITPHIVGAIVVFRLYYYVSRCSFPVPVHGNEILLRGGSCCDGGAAQRDAGVGALE